LPPGAVAPVADTGDEAQLYLQSGAAWVGIGADRYRTGLQLAPHVDLFLLDDGFQHWALARDLDLLLLDPLDPNGGGGLFPMGSLREPRTAAARADFVLAPRKRAENTIPPGRYGAFCAIGNPASFRAVLRTLPGVEIEEFRVFPDHSPIRRRDLEGLRRPMLTTAKDATRLPAGLTGVLVVKLQLELPEEDQILERIRTLLVGGKAG